MESDSGEFYLSDGSDDEYFEVLNEKGETIRDGDTVQIGRGDRVRLRFNALHMSFREACEHGTRYAASGLVQVDDNGCLVLPNGSKCQPDGSLIEIYPQNGNCLRFGRIADRTDWEMLLKRAHERPRAAVPSERTDFDHNARPAVPVAIETKDAPTRQQPDVLAPIRRRLAELRALTEPEQGTSMDAGGVTEVRS
jgi:hypothetical protein